MYSEIITIEFRDGGLISRALLASIISSTRLAAVIISIYTRDLIEALEETKFTMDACIIRVLDVYV